MPESALSFTSFLTHGLFFLFLKPCAVKLFTLRSQVAFCIATATCPTGASGYLLYLDICVQKFVPPSMLIHKAHTRPSSKCTTSFTLGFIAITCTPSSASITNHNRNANTARLLLSMLLVCSGENLALPGPSIALALIFMGPFHARLLVNAE